MTSDWFLTPSLVMAFVIGVTLVLGLLMPRMTRPDVFFAVTVPSEFRDSAEGWSILRRYRVEVAIFGVLAVLVVLAPLRMGESKYVPVVTLAGLLLQGSGVFFAYYRARARVLPHAVAPATVREAALAPRPVRLPGGWLLQFPPFAILAGTGIWLRTHWEQIPQSFPIHWGANGQPNNWSNRTPKGVYGPLLMGAVLCTLMGFLAFALLRWSRPVQAGGPAGFVAVPGTEEIQIDSAGNDLRRFQSEGPAHPPVLHDDGGGERRQQETRRLKKSAGRRDMAVRSRPPQNVVTMKRDHQRRRKLEPGYPPG